MHDYILTEPGLRLETNRCGLHVYRRGAAYGIPIGDALASGLVLTGNLPHVPARCTAWEITRCPCTCGAYLAECWSRHCTNDGNGGVDTEAEDYHQCCPSCGRSVQ